MKLTFKRVTRSLPEYNQLKKLYNNAFPANERAPFYILMSRRTRRTVDFWSVYAGGKWAGLAYLVSRRDVTYLFYLVVSEKMRGKGIGTQIIQTLKRLYEGQRLILALEPIEKDAPNPEERIKRRDFYLRCGLTPANAQIIEGDVVYDVMLSGGSVKPFEYGMLMHYFLGFPVNRLIRTRMIPKEEDGK